MLISHRRDISCSQQSESRWRAKMPSENVKEKVHRDFPKYNADITLRSLVWSAAVTSNAVKPQHRFIAFFYFPTTKVFLIIGPII